MSARKLQQEFDKLQKKVAEGLQVFDEIHDKIAATDNASQKDRLEGDLRKEIKKLQRSRDQLKQWLGDSSCKLDKNVLLDSRSRIEGAMERFKEVEKVSKMKQFSNEGLEMQAKLGARGVDEARKNEAARYVTEVLDELNRQNELLSAELTTYFGKKRLGAAQQAADELTRKIERNNGHIGNLERVLHNLENERLEPDRIEDIRDDLDYYVENNQAADFVEYNDFYDLLELDDAPEVPPIVQIPTEESVTDAVKEAPVVKESKEVVTRQVSETPSPAKAPRAPPPGFNTQSKPGSPVPQAPIAKSNAEELKKRVVSQAAVAAASRNTQLPTPLPVLTNENKTFWDTMPRLGSLALSRLSNPLPFHAISQALETSLLNCPDSFDLERPRQYNPVNVHPSSVDYPQEPMYELNAASIMKKFDIDTLFFCFYYSEGQDNLAKWNAARELSKRGWVFNQETKQWFCKDKPKGRSLSVVLTDDADAYKYFDYQSSWLTRRKEKFKFRPDLRQTFS